MLNFRRHSCSISGDTHAQFPADFAAQPHKPFLIRNFAFVSAEHNDIRDMIPNCFFGQLHDLDREFCRVDIIKLPLG